MADELRCMGCRVAGDFSDLSFTRGPNNGSVAKEILTNHALLSPRV
jgi:hypothetical protein